MACSKADEKSPSVLPSLLTTFSLNSDITLSGTIASTVPIFVDWSGIYIRKGSQFKKILENNKWIFNSTYKAIK